MPRSISRDMLRILNDDHVAPVSFLSIQLVGANAASAMHFCNAGYAITTGGVTYAPLAFGHSDTRLVLASDSGKVPGVTVGMDGVNESVCRLLADNEVPGADVVLRFSDRRLVSNPADLNLIAQGQLRNLQVSGDTVQFDIVPIVAMQEDCVIPRRVYQQNCGVKFGSPSCGVDARVSPYRVYAVAEASDRSWVQMPTAVTNLAGAIDPTEFWATGYIIPETGAAALQERPIMRVDGATRRFYPGWKWLKNPGLVSFLVARTCPKTVDACDERQGDVLNFRGYPKVPYGRIRPIIGPEITPHVP